MKQTHKLLALMCKYNDRTWWSAVDLLQQSEGTALFVGYEISPRMSDLARMFPDMIETGKRDKYRTIRMRFEDGRDWYPKLPDDYKKIVKEYYHGGNN